MVVPYPTLHCTPHQQDNTIPMSLTSLNDPLMHIMCYICLGRLDLLAIEHVWKMVPQRLMLKYLPRILKEEIPEKNL
ncbi:hypothetical protein CEXT_661251 [Caerostris extrusa]|uniref:Uncharacterized protein n=1 Tax=Caerostris extrusa TaxID=172846 RepID=A0AAV4XQV8_CAEEX|nr:hypothetical protein CEXT_661251 [Caerostris extrusa]